MTDATQDIAMGFLADKTSQEFKFDRKQQDQYAAKSYARARAATESGRAAPEIVPVQVEKGRGRMYRCKIVHRLGHRLDDNGSTR